MYIQTVIISITFSFYYRICQTCKVPISSDLENKEAIGFLFCDGMAKNHDEFFKNVSVARDMHKERFEVVVVPVHWSKDPLVTKNLLDEESYISLLTTNSSWLALPFKDPVCRKLWSYLCCYERHRSSDIPLLVIYQQFDVRRVERYGAEVLQIYGSDAFPFTRKKAVQMEIGKLKRWRLDSLLHQDLFSGVDRSPVSQSSDLWLL